MGTIGFIGAGNMGEALIRGILKANLAAPHQIIIADVNQKRRAQIGERYGVAVSESNSQVAACSEVTILAVKPQIIHSVVKEIGEVAAAGGNKLLISIAAGVRLSSLRACLSEGVRIIRVMPNTPALVLEGMSAICSDGADQEGLATAEKIFSAVGKVVIVEEGLIDAVTGLSGSGPAYVALMIEALADGGVLMGLPRKISQELALQTVLGTARLLMEANYHPAALKDMVSSPAGTTIQGIYALEKAGFRASLMEAVRSAAVRSKELGQS
ncbi:MAG: pyrroline-5-carboxylate reductase [bacterium]|nr:pyrroline-5-carboxylate reductase [bacterium]